MFNDYPINTIQLAMNRSFAQQNLIAQNIANVDTPGYKAKKVAFDSLLGDQLQAYRTRPGHISFSGSDPKGYHTEMDTYGTIQDNGNNVDIDHEMSELARNQLLYQTLSQSAADQFKKFNIVLGGNA
ncbi:flagellar basal body rod protein FlgB [Sporolactobacillus sp. THM19-2]|nr:flagellar basal body rod protein FlgB [Sporolactobacillus sp. THM19-2]